jgi:hypothetical protein
MHAGLKVLDVHGHVSLPAAANASLATMIGSDSPIANPFADGVPRAAGGDRGDDEPRIADLVVGLATSHTPTVSMRAKQRPVLAKALEVSRAPAQDGGPPQWLAHEFELSAQEEKQRRAQVAIGTLLQTLQAARPWAYHGRSEASYRVHTDLAGGPSYPVVDEELDRRVLKLTANQALEGLADLERGVLQDGTSERLNWVRATSVPNKSCGL